jgi:hypothetical protein
MNKLPQTHRVKEAPPDRKRIIGSRAGEASLLGKIADDRSGATAVVVALCMVPLMGFAGLAVDAGLWYGDRRAAQGAADSASYSGAIALAAGESSSDAVADAKLITSNYGLTDGTGGVSVTVNAPPASGPNVSTSGAVEVLVSKVEILPFSSFFIHAVTVSTRAVAVAGSRISKYCVLTLDPSANTGATSAAMSLINGADLDLSTCGIRVNATGSDALYLSGGAKLDAKTVSVQGTIQVSNGSQLNASLPPNHDPTIVQDPYAGVTIPTPGACASTNNYSSGTYTISPGTYCNGLTFAGSANITMSPGVYIIDRGVFSASGGANINATTGVTIVLTSSTGSNYATSSIAGGTKFSITAPTTGATAGLAIIQDSRASPSSTDDFSGGAQMTITGALDYPSELVNFSNGSANSSFCTQLVAYRVSFTGGSKFGNNCAGTGVVGIGTKATSLVE